MTKDNNNEKAKRAMGWLSANPIVYRQDKNTILFPLLEGGNPAYININFDLLQNTSKFYIEEGGDEMYHLHLWSGGDHTTLICGTRDIAEQRLSEIGTIISAHSNQGQNTSYSRPIPRYLVYVLLVLAVLLGGGYATMRLQAVAPPPPTEVSPPNLEEADKIAGITTGELAKEIKKIIKEEPQPQLGTASPNQLPLPTALLNDGRLDVRKFKEMGASAWVYGDPKNEPLYIFTDPSCPGCKKYFKMLQEEFVDEFYLQFFPVAMIPGNEERSRDLIARCGCSPQQAETFKDWMGLSFPPKELSQEDLELGGCAEASLSAVQNNNILFLHTRVQGVDLQVPMTIRSDGKILRTEATEQELRKWLEN